MRDVHVTIRLWHLVALVLFLLVGGRQLRVPSLTLPTGGGVLSSDGTPNDGGALSSISSRGGGSRSSGSTTSGSIALSSGGELSASSTPRVITPSNMQADSLSGDGSNGGLGGSPSGNSDGEASLARMPSPQLTNTVLSTGLAAASTPLLIAELHHRDYKWEALAAAGLGFDKFSELEILTWLKRNTAKFLDVLDKTGLGLRSVSSVRLLGELSKREDLGKALQETGLGAGADFNCAEDESPRDGGCQVRCQAGNCARAHAVCRKISHCVKVDVNRGKTWATLKSLQVYMPRPVAQCDGYAFDAKGSDPQPLAGPEVVEFEVPTPNEEWCYRDTGFSAAAQASYRRESRERSCTMETCFDLKRCSLTTASRNRSAPLAVFVGVETPRGEDMVRLPGCIRQTQRKAIVDTPSSACLFFPTVNINCQWDQCDPATHSLLRGLPSWGGNGANHIIWDYNDAANVKYRTDQALFVKSSMNIDHYRAGFDVPFPLLPNGVATHVTSEDLQAAQGNRHVLLSFKGVCQAASHRNLLSSLHNGQDVLIVCSNTPRSVQYDYKTLMLSSVFSAAPAGNGLHSYRLAEAIFLGAIPVIVDDKLILPFCSVLDWRQFSVRVPSSQISRLPEILRQIEPARVERMQRRLAEVKRRYFLFPFTTAMSLIRFRVRALQRSAVGNSSA